MENLDNELLSASPVVVAQIFSKLVQVIKEKEQSDVAEVPEFKFLKEKCLSENNSISTAAAAGVLDVVRNGRRSFAKTIISDLTTIVKIRKSSTNVASLINSLMLIDTECEYNLRVPQHPFVTLLSEDPGCWLAIYKEITYFRAVELYKPVFLYTLCNPQHGNLSPFNQKLWTFIVNNGTPDLVISLLSWMQFEYKGKIQENSDFLVELAEVNCTKRYIDENVLFLWQVAALHHLIAYNFDPQSMIHSILGKKSVTKDNVALKSSLLILVKSLTLCPSAYLKQLLILYKELVSQTECDNIIKQIIKSSLLQWMANPCVLTSEAVAVANEIFLFVDKSPTKLQSSTNPFWKKIELINTNKEVYMSVQLCLLLNEWNSNEDVLRWLQNLRRAPAFFTTKIVDFLFGLFLSDFDDTTINSLVFDLIMKCIESEKMLASNVLTATLYKLPNTTDPKLHYQMLKAIPKMVAVKNNLQKIIATIQALNKGSNVLKTFSTSLMLDLWKMDNKCYPHLEKLLVTPYDSQCDRWEFYVTRAHILKELCALKPELYGKEMVAHLSKILNECGGGDGALACALAIDGITLLCKSEIIDAVTTWATLAPMFKTETRIPVIKSLCSLISEIPSLPYTEAYPKLLEDVVRQLWEYILLNPEDEVWKAALTALTSFTVEQIVAQMPEEYFEEETLNVRKSGQVVPGHCWITLMKNCDKAKLKIAADFLTKMVSLEISGYLKFVYQVKGPREPVDYSYLPVNSIVRGLSTYIKSKIVKWKLDVYKEVYLECLRIFSREFSKPLPPLDWCFLQELIHEPESKNFALTIACHQVILSGTARRLMVNYIEAVTQNADNVNDVLIIYNNLKHLANSVQPFTLRPFFEVTIAEAVQLFKDGSEERLVTILKHLKETLSLRGIQEANKTVIAQILSDLVVEADITSKLFETLLDCVVLFPTKHIDDISSPKSVKQATPEWLKKAVRIRCHLAVNSTETPLNWLNDFIEMGSVCNGIRTFLFEQFTEVFLAHKDSTECVLWFLELLGRIQAATTEKSDAEILFLCNIFVLATIVFSGHFVLTRDLSDCDESYKLFPRAIATLLDVNQWSICTNQALEWCHHMHTEKILAKECGAMFMQCLKSLRHETEFHKNMKWTKYLNVEC